jgi:hypothetical protein
MIHFNHLPATIALTTNFGLFWPIRSFPWSGSDLAAKVNLLSISRIHYITSLLDGLQQSNQCNSLLGLNPTLNG